jgi:hypothetical protein
MKFLQTLYLWGGLFTILVAFIISPFYLFRGRVEALDKVSKLKNKSPEVSEEIYLGPDFWIDCILVTILSGIFWPLMLPIILTKWTIGED